MAVGFSTGCFHGSGKDLMERVRFYLSLGADALELNFGTPEQIADFELSDELAGEIKKFSYVSIHAPWKQISYGANETTERVVKKLKELCGELPIKGVVIHPDVVEDFSYLDSLSLPLLIENMDNRKAVGIDPEYFKNLRSEYSFGFVFDVQHAFEHDGTMDVGKGILDAMGGRLAHMHVSGCVDGERHYPTFASKNRAAIEKILAIGVDVPKILEGLLIKDPEDMGAQELAFIKKYEEED